MTLVPNEVEQALNRQHDVYATAREEYRKKITEQAQEIERLRAELLGQNAKQSDEIERLRAALNEALTKVENDRTMWSPEWLVWAQDARAALGGKDE